MALERERRLCQFMLGFMEASLDTVPADAWTKSHCEGGQTPMWIVGHLVSVADSACAMAGGKSILGPEWKEHFGRGSAPNQNPHPHPDIYDLREMFRERMWALLESIAAADDSSLDDPHPLELEQLKQALPTKADLLGHVLTTHLATHAGQLSAWRRQEGFEPIF